MHISGGSRKDFLIGFTVNLYNNITVTRLSCSFGLSRIVKEVLK